MDVGLFGTHEYLMDSEYLLIIVSHDILNPFLTSRNG